MADKKISQLTAATTPLAGTEVLPVVQGSTTVKVSVDNLTTGKTVPAGYINIKQLNEYPANPAGVNYIRQSSTASWQTYIAADGNFSFYNSTLADRPFYMTTDGNLAVNTAGKGIDFSANTHAAGMTSELLNWYEVGTWTGTLTATTPPTVPVTATGRYTRIGNQVTIAIEFENVSTVGAVGGLEVTGLPFTAVSSGYGPAMKSGLGTQAVTAGIYGGLSKVIFSDSGTMNNTPIVAGVGVYLRFSATYFM